MKNTTKTIAAVLVLILAVALFVGAASAAEARDVANGQTAFVYENITVGGQGTGYLNFYDKDDVFVTSINATNGGFNLLDVAVGSKEFHSGWCKRNHHCQHPVPEPFA